MALAAVCGAVSFFTPVVADNGNDLSQEFENTLLASVDQADNTREQLEGHSDDCFDHRFNLRRRCVYRRHSGGLRQANHQRAGARHQNVANQPPVVLPPTNPLRRRPRRPGRPEILSKDFLQRLDTELRLNKDEHEAVQKIISDGQNQMRKVLQDARLEIREVLTPQQRDQFDELMKRPFHKPILPPTPRPDQSPPPTSRRRPIPCPSVHEP